MHVCERDHERCTVQYDKVSCVELYFQVVCEDGFTIVTNPSMSLFVGTLMIRNMVSA